MRLFTPKRRLDRQGLSYRLGVEFEAARVRQLYALMPQAVLGGLLIIAALTVYYLGDVEWWKLAAWVAVMLLVFGLRYASKRLFDQVRSDVEAIAWERYAVWLALASGLGLASFVVVLAEVTPFERHYFYYMLLAASLIAASVTQAPSNPAFLAFALGILPLSVPVLLWVRSSWSLEIALLVIGFLGYLALGFRRIHQSLMESLEVRMEARQLAEQESRLLDAAQSGIVFLMRDLIVRCNRAFAEMAGVPGESGKLQRLEDVIRDPREREALMEFLQRAQRDVPARALNIRLRADGPVPLWCTVTASPIRARHADAGSVLIFTNITEEKRAQQGYELALEAAGVGVWDVDLADGRFTPSRALLRLLGDPEGKAGIASLEHVLHPDDGERVRAAQQAHIDGEADFDLTFALRRLDGHSVRVHGRGACARDAGGRATRFIGVVTALDEAS